MKITRSRLKQIIKEEVSNLSLDEASNIHLMMIETLMSNMKGEDYKKDLKHLKIILATIVENLKSVIQPDSTRLNESYTENWMRGYATTAQLGLSQKRPWMKDFHVVSAMPLDPSKPKLYAVFAAPGDTTPKWTGSFEEFKALEPADLLPGTSR